jgi:anti-anti-sigma factor
MLNEGGSMVDAAFQTEVAHKESMPDVTSIRIRGRVTHDEGARLRDFLIGEVSQVSTPKLILELSGIDVFDTAGAAVLVETLLTARKLQKTILMCSPSDPVMRVFRLAGFEDVLERCTRSPEETMQRLAS